jgi:uncharacterized membrane protein YvbJ
LSNQNSSPNRDNKGNWTQKKKLIWAGVFVVFILLLANKESGSESSASKTKISKGVISSSSCINKIHSITQYERGRLKYTGDNDSSVYVSYKNDFGRIHKFRCLGSSGTVELVAEGAGIWMAM